MLAEPLHVPEPGPKLLVRLQFVLLGSFLQQHELIHDFVFLLFRVHVDLIALGSSWSRTCCALEKAGWSTVKVQMREMFPPGTVCSVDFFSPPSVSCCRARILHASGRRNVKSASYLFRTSVPLSTARVAAVL